MFSLTEPSGVGDVTIFALKNSFHGIFLFCNCADSAFHLATKDHVSGYSGRYSKQEDYNVLWPWISLKYGLIERVKEGRLKGSREN